MKPGNKKPCRKCAERRAALKRLAKKLVIRINPKGSK